MALAFHLNVVEALLKELGLPFHLLQESLHLPNEAQRRPGCSSIGVEFLEFRPQCELLRPSPLICLSEHDVHLHEGIEVHVCAATRLHPSNEELDRLVDLMWYGSVRNSCIVALLEDRISLAAGWAVQLVLRGFFGMRRSQDFALYMLDGAFHRRETDSVFDREFLQNSIAEYMPQINFINRYQSRAKRSLSNLDIEDLPRRSSCSSVDLTAEGEALTASAALAMVGEETKSEPESESQSRGDSVRRQLEDDLKCASEFHACSMDLYAKLKHEQLPEEIFAQLVDTHQLLTAAGPVDSSPRVEKNLWDCCHR